jgi:hypothetical protein
MVYIHIIFSETKFIDVLFQIFHSHNYEYGIKNNINEYRHIAL